MVTTNIPALAERVRLLRSHGQKERYRHVALGYNYRMTEMQAALGLVQIEKLEDFTKRRIANAAFLTEHLAKVVQTPVVRPGHRHVYHQYTIRVPGKRNEWVKSLHERGIGTAIHYPLAIHQQPFYQASTDAYRISSVGKTSLDEGSEMKQMQLPVAETAAEQVLSLPVHPIVSRDDLKKIVEEILALCALCV